MAHSLETLPGSIPANAQMSQGLAASLGHPPLGSAPNGATSLGPAPFAPRDVNAWSIHDVSGWLGAAGLSHLVSPFQMHRITGDVLLDLSIDDLAEIGVHALGDKKRLLRAVAQLRTPQGYLSPMTSPSQDVCMQPLMQPCSQQGLQQGCPPTFPLCQSSPPPNLVPNHAHLVAGSAPEWI